MSMQKIPEFGDFLQQSNHVLQHVIFKARPYLSSSIKVGTMTLSTSISVV